MSSSSTISLVVALAHSTLRRAKVPQQRPIRMWMTRRTKKGLAMVPIANSRISRTMACT